MNIKKSSLVFLLFIIFCKNSFADFSTVIANSSADKNCKSISDATTKDYCKKTFVCLYKQTTAQTTTCLTDTSQSCNSETNDQIKASCTEFLSYASAINTCNTLPTTSEIYSCSTAVLQNCSNETDTTIKNSCLKMISAKGAKGSAAGVLQMAREQGASAAATQKRAATQAYNTIVNTNLSNITIAQNESNRIKQQALSDIETAKAAGQTAKREALDSVNTTLNNRFVENTYDSITEAQSSFKGSLIPSWLSNITRARSTDVVRMKTNINTDTATADGQKFALTFTFNNALALSPIYNTNDFCSKGELDTYSNYLRCLPGNVRNNYCGRDPFCRKSGKNPYGPYITTASQPTPDIALPLTISTAGSTSLCIDLLAERILETRTGMTDISGPSNPTSDWNRATIPYTISTLEVPNYPDWQNKVQNLYNAGLTGGFYLYKCDQERGSSIKYYLAVHPQNRKAYMWGPAP